MVIPRAFSSGAESISSYRRAWARPLVCRTPVIAAVRVVLPWSTWPIVPMLTCGFFRSNLALAIVFLCSYLDQFVGRPVAQFRSHPNRRQGHRQPRSIPLVGLVSLSSPNIEFSILVIIFVFNSFSVHEFWMQMKIIQECKVMFILLHHPFAIGTSQTTIASGILCTTDMRTYSFESYFKSMIIASLNIIES